MREDVIIISRRATDVGARNLLKLVRFIGLSAKAVFIEKLIDGGTNLLALGRAKCVVADAAAMGDLMNSFGEDKWDEFFRETRFLVFGFCGEPEAEGALVQRITKGRLCGVKTSRSGTFEVSEKARDFCRQFSGLTFGNDYKGDQTVFAIREDDDEVERLISIDGKGFVVRVSDESRDITFWGSRGCSDLDAQVPRGTGVLDLFGELIPAMMYFHFVFGDRCWHAKRRVACLILDDPSLRKRYGFVKYGALLESMCRKRFATSIAFIPWNYRRSNAAVAEVFRDNSEYLSINVHGCDHNEGEFGIVDEAALRHKVETAIARMKHHKEETGVAFDPVMVFPQGVFSSVALKILDKYPFLAAVNTTPFPVDRGKRGFTLRCLLGVTVSGLEGIPLFTRRYPGDIAGFALDLFLGKPAIGVEHHLFFKSGYGDLEKWVDMVNSLDGNIEWRRLGDVVRQSSLQRRTQEAWEIRIFTNEAEILNIDPRPRTFRVRKTKGNLKEIREIIVNGKRADFSDMNGEISFSASLPAGACFEVKIVEKKRAQEHAYRYKAGYRERTKVAARRYLCDFRDNYLARSDFLLRLANSAKSTFFEMCRNMAFTKANR